ncbi:MAG: hypothetical protein EB043_05330 [Actinobacteria bacterium]|jgi:uncharacterized protein (DUF58 family)|nr:hypothetical protein [Actinomycetota bacterium]
MKKIALLVSLTGVGVGALVSVRVGALIIASSLILYVSPDFRLKRPIERVIVLSLIVSLITVALALPRR